MRRFLAWLRAKGKAVAAMAPYWGGVVMRRLRAAGQAAANFLRRT